MRYEIVKDIGKLKDFINWLPDLEPHEKYYLALFARKKYDETGVVGNDKVQLKRITARKHDIVPKIRQMEIGMGRYTTKDRVAVPQDSLALYIMPNPRSMIDAAKRNLIDLAKAITRDYNGYSPYAMAMTAIHKAKSRNFVLDFDFDNVSSQSIMSSLELCINSDAYTLLITRGGLHVLIHLDKIESQFRNTFYGEVIKIPGCDQRGDNFIPVPGCTQGGFVPYLRERTK